MCMRCVVVKILVVVEQPFKKVVFIEKSGLTSKGQILVVWFQEKNSTSEISSFAKKRKVGKIVNFTLCS